jgi:hypothetical protein
MKRAAKNFRNVRRDVSSIIEMGNIVWSRINYESFERVMSIAKLAVKPNENVISAKKKINEIINSIHVPYSKGKAFYYLDMNKREIVVYIPVKRASVNVGKACLKIWKDLEKAFPGWGVEVWSELTPPESWGVPMSELTEILLNAKRSSGNGPSKK